VLLFQLSYIKGWCGETSMPGTRYRIVNNRKWQELFGTTM